MLKAVNHVIEEEEKVWMRQKICFFIDFLIISQVGEEAEDVREKQFAHLVEMIDKVSLW